MERVITMNFGFPTDTPTEEETAILDAYENGDPEYQPFMTHEELLKELDI